MSNREILIPVHALVETLAKQSDENTPIKINNSDATTKTVTKYAAALVVGPSQSGKELTVIRTHGGVYRVPTEAVENGTHGAIPLSPTQFLRYHSLFNSPSSTETTTVPTTKAAKALLTQCLSTISSHHDKGIELCVAGQNTIFLSTAMQTKLQRLDHVHQKNLRRQTTHFRRLFRTWQAYVAASKQSVVTIQTLCRKRALRKNISDDQSASPLGEMSRSLCAVIALQAHFRGRSVRKTYAQLVLQTLPGQTCHHQRLEKVHRFMSCAIQLRDAYDCERYLEEMIVLHLRLTTLHDMAFGPYVVSSFDQDISSGEKGENRRTTLGAKNIVVLMKGYLHEAPADYGMIEALFQKMLVRYNDILTEAREAAGCSNLASIEQLIQEAEKDMSKAIALRQFEVCSQITSTLERLHRARNHARDETTALKTGSGGRQQGGDGGGAGKGAGAGGGEREGEREGETEGEGEGPHPSELDLLRQELNTTRQMVTSMQMDQMNQSHFKHPQHHQHHNDISRHLPLSGHLSPTTLHRHTQAMKEDDVQSSNGTSVFSLMSKITTNDSVFTYKMTDNNGQVRRFKSSASKIGMLFIKVRQRLGVVETTCLKIFFVDEDGDRVVLLSDEDLQDAVELARMKNGGDGGQSGRSNCLKIIVEQTTAEEKNIVEESEEDSSGSSSESDSTSSSSASDQEEYEKVLQVQQATVYGGNNGSKQRNMNQSYSSVTSSSSSSDSETDSSSDGLEFPNQSMSMSVKKASAHKSKTQRRRVHALATISPPKAPVVASNENLLRMRSTIERDRLLVQEEQQRRRNAVYNDDTLDTKTILGSVVFASALAAVSVFAIKMMKR